MVLYAASSILLFQKLTLTKCGLSTVVYGRLGVYFMYVITNIWHSQPCMKWNHIYIYFLQACRFALLCCKDPRDWFFCEPPKKKKELALSTEFFMFIWERIKRSESPFHNLLRQHQPKSFFCAGCGRQYSVNVVHSNHSIFYVKLQTNKNQQLNRQNDF